MKRLLILFLATVLMLISDCSSDNHSTDDEIGGNTQEISLTEDSGLPNDTELLPEKETTTPSQSDEKAAGISPTTEQRSDADTVDVSKSGDPSETEPPENHTPPSESKSPNDISVNKPSAETPSATENPPVRQSSETEETKEPEPIVPDPHTVNSSQTNSKPEWNIKKIREECIRTAQDMGYTLNKSLTADNSSCGIRYRFQFQTKRKTSDGSYLSISVFIRRTTF